MDTSPMPTEVAVRKALRQLCTDSVREAWLVKNRCRVLVDLAAVRTRANGGDAATSEELRDALVSYLDEVLDRLEQEQYQILLRIAMALEPQYRTMTAAERYAEVGRKFRGEGAKVVKAGTIRQHHTKKAVAALAPIIIADEAELR